MATFSRSSRSLATDDFRRRAWVLLLATLLLGAWLALFFLVPMAAYASLAGVGATGIDSLTPAELVWRSLHG